MSEGAGAGLFDQVSRDGKVDICLKQRHADLAACVRDVVFAEAPETPEVLEDGLETIGELFEHAYWTLAGRGEI